MNVPEHLMYPPPAFTESFHERILAGQRVLLASKIAVVGLARNCAVRLAENLGRLEHLAGGCREWCLHVESNDCTDQTVPVLTDFCHTHRQATFHYEDYGRPQFSAEFAGPRTIALAEYRDACQRWVRECAADSDFVLVIDWDQWGGWSTPGVLNGIGWLAATLGAYGMASVSLMQHAVTITDSEGTRPGSAWLHYDAWALRLNAYWDDYTAGLGAWKHHWLPAVGSPPALVRSAFGGLCIYRTADYLRGTYAGEADCEHVPFHESIATATARHLYMNPSQRCVMHWMEPADAGQHRND